MNNPIERVICKFIGRFVIDGIIFDLHHDIFFGLILLLVLVSCWQLWDHSKWGGIAPLKKHWIVFVVFTTTLVETTTTAYCSGDNAAGASGAAGSVAVGEADHPVQVMAGSQSPSSISTPGEDWIERYYGAEAGPVNAVPNHDAPGAVAGPVNAVPNHDAPGAVAAPEQRPPEQPPAQPQELENLPKPTLEDFHQLLQNHQSIADLLPRIFQDLHTRVPAGFQSERLAEILEARHGGRKLGGILRSLQAEGRNSPFFREVQTDFQALRESGGTEATLRKEWQGRF